ncbi:MAG: hypothetical protein JWM98_2470 [Thermoleophilia bacterium]|nr:hypothetical protein [Thermoleophilia bacterium]
MATAPDLTADSRSALLVVDMQVGMAAGSEQEGMRLAQRIAEHVRRVGAHHGLVAASLFRNVPGCTYDRLVASDMRGDDECALLEPIAALGLECHELPTYSSLGEELAARLRASGTERVHVVGMDTDQCVLATVFALFDAGFEPIVARDLCISTAGDVPHEAGIVALHRAIGEPRVIDAARIEEATLGAGAVSGAGPGAAARGG